MPRPNNVLFLFLVSVLLQSISTGNAAEIEPRVSKIAPTATVQFDLQSRLIDAVPGDVIELAEGRYELKHQLSVVSKGLTIRGAGSDKTILTFQGQVSGSAGLEATGDHLVLEGFAIEDTAGNAIKVLGANHVTFRDVRTEWTGPPTEKNGAYGIYPVQCRNVLMDRCVAIGASDAGIYVGQSQNVIVRNCRAERNVAGIEIENTISADVYDNVATNNAAGLLVFDLPGLQVTNGREARIYRNKVFDNNHPNFASKGSIVASVPPGIGSMILSSDDVELFENEIKDHQTSAVLILSYGTTGTKLKDKKYDQYPEGISIHDNEIANSGYDPKGALSAVLKAVLGKKFPDILWDGVVNKKGTRAEDAKPSIRNNGDIRFANFDFANFSPTNVFTGKYAVKRDLAAHTISRAALPVTKLEPSNAESLRTDSNTRAVQVYRAAEPRLSGYELFDGPMAEQRPAKGVVPYDLNTPLFSDFTTKYRFIKVPEGSEIGFRDVGVLDFPVGTVIAKTFSYPHDMRDPSKGERLLETRIEMREEDNWYGFSYLWNEDQTDAELVLGGSELDVSWIHDDGERQHSTYQVPNVNQCISCHQLGEKFVPIGPVAANMDRDFNYGHGVENQLTHLQNQKLLSSDIDLAAVHAWPTAISDNTHETANSDSLVKDRARTWLHVNCAHCHRPEGTARTSGLDLRISQSDPAKLGVWKTPVAAGHGTGGHSYDIVPGKPNESILLHRIQSTDPSVTMPSIAKSMVYDDAVSLVRDWIAQMESDPDSK